MLDAFTAYRLLLFVTAGLTVTLAGFTWQHRDVGALRTLSILMVSVSVWLLGYALAATTGDFDRTVLLIRITWVGIPFTVFAMFVFVLQYTGREGYLTPRYLVPLAVYPLVVSALVWTNEHHRLVFGPVEADPTTFTGVWYTGNTGFWVHVAITYVLLLVASGLLLRFVYRSQRLYRHQAIALVIAVLAPWAGNAIYLSGLVEAMTGVALDSTPVGFAVSGIALTWAIAHARLTDVAPIARTVVFDNMSDGVIVLDRDDRVVDVNPMGRRMLDVEDDEAVIGHSIERIISSYPSVYEQYADADEIEEQLTIETESGPVAYNLSIAPLRDRRGRTLGRVVMLHDVTELKRRERELAHSNERLERFASVVSHDLRNPLNVAEGYLELVRETGQEEYVDEVEISHDRMRRIIEDVLTLAQDADANMAQEPVVLRSVAEDAWSLVTTEDAILQAESGVSVLADRDRLQRLLENLFRNAIEHGDSDVTVTVEGIRTVDPGPETRSGDGVLTGFAVADDGPGIDPDNREQILEPGYTDGGGTGLGLSIASDIAAAHGWSIRVTESESGGARFAFDGVRVPDETGSHGADRPDDVGGPTATTEANASTELTTGGSDSTDSATEKVGTGYSFDEETTVEGDGPTGDSTRR